MPRDVVEETLEHMRASYGDFIDRESMLPLDPTKVPSDLLRYIPYAALWGVADDLERERLVQTAPDKAKAELIRVVKDIDDRLDVWLAGYEATSPTPTAEYIAFSAMRMAADFM